MDKNGVSISSSPISMQGGNKPGEYEALYKRFNDDSFLTQFKTQPKTLDELFLKLFTPILKTISPHIQIILIPSTRDAISNHAAYPQASLNRKALQLPKKNFKCMTNPSSFQINEIYFGCSNVDTFKDLKEVIKGGSTSSRYRLDRVSEHILQPVSYTHLDVYKRQLLEIFRKLNSKHDNTLKLKVNDLMPKLLNCLFQVYGKEFDYTCYFNLIFEIYKFHNERFDKLLTDFDIVSTKMKICHELEKKDASFRIENIISRENSVSFTSIDNKKFERDDDFDEAADDENDVKKYMEMTMINPFKSLETDKTLGLKNNVDQKRTSSTDSVVFHDDNEKDKKLSEMTKIVSVYQLDYPNPVKEEENDQDMDNSPKSDLNLSEIFHNSNDNTEKKLKDDNEPTVKFSTDPPKIMNECKKSVENENEKPDLETMSPIKGDEDENMDQKHRTTVKRERELTLTEQDINSKRLKLVNNKKPETTKFSIMDNFLKDSLTVYEISHLLMVDSIGNTSMDSSVYFSHMLKAINRIKSGSFTMKHINYLIEPLIICFQNQKMINWLTNENGFDELLAVAIMLLKSTDDTPSIPSKISSKSIILVHSLLVWKKFLNKVDGNADDDGVSLRMSFEEVWEQILLMLNKFSDYGNEIYKLAQEFRDNLMLSNFFKKHSATRILSMLVTEIQPDTAGVKETFLMETLWKMLLSPTICQQFKKSNLSEIIQTMSYFTMGSDNTSWNFTSAVVLAHCLRLLQSAPDSTEQETERLFDCLPKDVFKMIMFIASNE